MSQTVLAIGNFDGVHKGHQALFRAAKQEADALGLAFCVLTFSPHPRRFFLPDSAPFLIDTPEIKQQMLSKCGADTIFIEAFDHRFAQQTASEFVTETLYKKYNAAHIFVGNDFVYGHHRGGNIQTLTTDASALGMHVTPLPKVFDDAGEIYSSTLMRECLQEGNIPRANHILGRCWQTEGVVIHGEKRGRTIGFPTANLHPSPTIIAPRFGVYAVSVRTKDGNTYRAVANFGTRPTVDAADKPRLEVHIMNFNGNLYGQNLKVLWHAFLRPEQRFDRLKALKTQISQDICAAERELALIEETN